MSKFCQECGAKLVNDNAKFCSECGNKILRINSEKADTSSINNNVIEKNTRIVVKNGNNSRAIVNLILLLIGGLAIFSLYLFPVVEISELSMTTADIHSYCSNTLIRALSGGVCSKFDTIFYTGWIVGIILIIFAVVDYLRSN